MESKISDLKNLRANLACLINSLEFEDKRMKSLKLAPGLEPVRQAIKSLEDALYIVSHEIKNAGGAK